MILPESHFNSMTDRVLQIINNLDTHSVVSVTNALEVVKEIDDLVIEEKVDLLHALSDVFFHTHHTGATHFPKLAVHIEKGIVRFGPELIPFLVDEIIEADSESAVYFGQTLARHGNTGLQYLVSKVKDFQHQEHYLINIIQAFSYFRISEVINAIPDILLMAKSHNHQVTSMSLYTAGRLVQRLPQVSFNTEIKELMFDSVFYFLSNPQGLVRKNAARCLGKMMRKGLLSYENEKKLNKVFLAITGRDEKNNWDRAFIVRREAEEFLPYFRQLHYSSQKYNQQFKILSKKLLCPNTYYFSIEAPFIAQKIEAGQFIIIRPHIFSERIPLSVCGWNRKQGFLNIIVSAVGKTTHEINMMEPGDLFQDVVGPLGERSSLPHSSGTCVVIGGGYGTGAIIPTARDIKSLGNKVIGIVGARNQDNLIMVNELSQVCDEVIVTTNDGSKGLKGFVTDALQSILEQHTVVYVLAVGPVPMMKAVSELTRARNIATYVSLNAIMVDGTGMCGACRVTVDGETKFACFHGPDFDGHKVDFENLMKRQKMFVKQEQLALTNLRS